MKPRWVLLWAFAVGGCAAASAAQTTRADLPVVLNAIRTAAAPGARGKGVMIVMNDEISAAREVTKTNTYRVETFRAPELGFLGYVDADQVSFYRTSTKRHTSRSEFDVSSIAALPRVDIVYSYVEPNPAMIQALADSGDRGIVFAATGAGTLSSFEKRALQPSRCPRRPARCSYDRAGRAMAASSAATSTTPWASSPPTR
jgi:L-asparaginase/Glu-tRNA(Gln) amidotransferase subunit D